MKPLREEKRPRRPARVKAKKPGNPREEWVRESIEGYVIRWHSAGWGGNAGWTTTPVTNLDHARLAAETLDPKYLIYAVRTDANGEQHLALITREELTQ